MKRLLVAAGANPQGWVALFRAALPEHAILDAPPDDGAPVAYVVAGRPPPGLIAGIPGLELVLSLNAGIEHLLAGGEVPPAVPIVRLVDHGLAAGMADWVLAQVLGWHRNLFAYRGLQATGRWAPMEERLAEERVVTVLGAGALGGPVIDHLLRFGFRTRAWSRTGRAVAGAATFSGADGLPQAVAGADVLVNLLPLTPATENLLDARVFAAMARGGFVVNAARGGHVVDADLIAALDSGQLGGAALDVFRTEPLPAGPLPGGHPFWTHPAILLSPHVAAPTHARTAVAAIAASVRRHERGEPVANLVDRSRGY